MSVWVSVTNRVSPKMSWPVPNVTMNEGILSPVTSSGVDRADRDRPRRSASRIAAQIGQPQMIQLTEMSDAANPYVKPNERSISPTTMTSSSPSATIAIVLIPRMITSAFGDVEERVRLADQREDDDDEDDREREAADAEDRLPGATGPHATARAGRRGGSGWGGAIWLVMRRTRSVVARRMDEGRATGVAASPGLVGASGAARQPPVMRSELLASLLEVLQRDRHEHLRVRADDAVLQEVGAGDGAERGLVAPPLVERGDLDALLDARPAGLR